jgi:hypothetical protein
MMSRAPLIREKVLLKQDLSAYAIKNNGTLINYHDLLLTHPEIVSWLKNFFMIEDFSEYCIALIRNKTQSPMIILFTEDFEYRFMFDKNKTSLLSDYKHRKVVPGKMSNEFIDIGEGEYNEQTFLLFCRKIFNLQIKQLA